MNKELHSAASRGDIETVLSILDQGGNVHEIGPHHWPLLVRAAVDGHAALVEKLLERGAERDACDRDGKTALHWAAMRGRTEVVELLLDRGAPVDLRDVFGQYTPLYLAASHAPDTRAQSAIALLLSRGADVDARTVWGTTALTSAAFRDATALIHFLIDEGADVNSRAKNGRTALIMATDMGFRPRETIPVLLARGADPDIPDNEGKTALMWAAFHARQELVELLLAGGADLALRDHAGWTALMHAAGLSPKASTIGMLTNVPDPSGKNAPRLEKAWQIRAKTVRFLLERGSDPAVTDHQGRTALDVARLQHGNSAVAEALHASVV